MILICAKIVITALNSHYKPMYICVCQAVTERELHETIEAGAVTLQRLRE